MCEQGQFQGNLNDKPDDKPDGYGEQPNMRSRVSTAMATLVASALVASLASAAPIVRFGQGEEYLPQECIVVNNEEGLPIDLDCVAAAATPLYFSVIVEIGYTEPINPSTDGTAGASFSAEWDAGLQNALGSASAAAGGQTRIMVDAGPPKVFVGYTPATSDPTVTNSTGASAGLANSWNFIANSPASDTNLQTAGFSYRAGTLSVTVDEVIETTITLGNFVVGVNGFLAANGTVVVPDFGMATINAPEPSAALGLLAGLGSVALLARRSRRS